jgi:hypothetical protein
MKLTLCLFWACSLAILFPPGVRAETNPNLRTTWLWHLHQPIDWPDHRDYGTDRVNAYQGEPRFAVGGRLGCPNPGLQVNNSGAWLQNFVHLPAGQRLRIEPGHDNGARLSASICGCAGQSLERSGWCVEQSKFAANAIEFPGRVIHDVAPALLSHPIFALTFTSIKTIAFRVPHARTGLSNC